VLEEERYSRRIWKKDNQGLHQDALHKKRYSRKRKNIKSADKVFRKQTLESLDPLLQLNWRRALNIRFQYDPSEDKSFEPTRQAGN